MYTIRQIAERTGATKQRVRRLIREQGIRTTKVGSDNKELKKAGFKTGMIVVTDAEAESLIALLKKDTVPESEKEIPDAPDTVPESEKEIPDAPDTAPESEKETPEVPDAAPETEEEASEVPDAALKTEEASEAPDAAPETEEEASEVPDAALETEEEAPEETDTAAMSEEKKAVYSVPLRQADELNDPLSALIREKNERIRQLQEDLELERQRAEEERHRYDVLMTVINRQSLDIQRMIALGVSGVEVEETEPAGGMDPGETTEQAAEKPLSQEETARSDVEGDSVPETKRRSGPGRVLLAITRRKERPDSAVPTDLEERSREEEICEDCDPTDIAEETASSEENAVQKYDDGGIQLELKAVAGKKDTLGGTVVPLYPELINDSLPELEESGKKSLLRRFLEVFGIMDA